MIATNAIHPDIVSFEYSLSRWIIKARSLFESVLFEIVFATVSPNANRYFPDSSSATRYKS